MQFRVCSQAVTRIGQHPFEDHLGLRSDSPVGPRSSNARPVAPDRTRATGVFSDSGGGAQSFAPNLPILLQMKKRIHRSAWARSFERQFVAMTRVAMAGDRCVLAKVPRPMAARQMPLPEVGTRTSGVDIGASGARRFRLNRPPGSKPGERLLLMAKQHGCGQDADSFGSSTRLNRVALREHFLVRYQEQDRFANAPGCWTWFDTDSGLAYGEVALITRAIDEVCLLHPVDSRRVVGTRVVVAGLSADAWQVAVRRALPDVGQGLRAQGRHGGHAGAG